MGEGSLFTESSPPSYARASQELVIAWEKLYPLPFREILKQDPLKKGIQTEKRKDTRKVWMYNFLVFMPKYDRRENVPVPRKEGREVQVIFLWEPNHLEEPYRLQLGEWNGN
ncbi:hypothetical protein [Leptospira ilyithenensis]|uniref:hypothetical protein n=1 Tax=Leptospira ilyithenensis TaxID=2484901 RepID=UPI001FE70686|nr:hypothetical protein [Leptospira ilyithenensis]